MNTWYANWPAFLKDPKFWAALLWLLQTVLFLVRPDFPPELWVALSGVLGVIFGLPTATQAVARRQVRMANRQIKD